MLNIVKEHFRTFNKFFAGTLIVKLTNIKFDGMHEMYEHVIKLSNLTAQLKNLRIFVNEFVFGARLFSNQLC